ncbi:MAG TPA: hypothetical protein DGR97_08245 [Gammaproteobacteria bacterium]|nr:hypothetical protein [Gammaproteobacteria bacterium]|tara:strand:- start:222 stop:932 length:711 start_codon:yes stop_codon:yes gene_type:complete
MKSHGSKRLLATLSVLAALFILTSHITVSTIDPLGDILVRDRVTGVGFKEAVSPEVGINSRGLRDSEHQIEKPADVYRIAFLGGSYMAGLGVLREETFWHLMSTRLASCPFLDGKRIEPINFAVPSFDTAQELLTLRHRVWRYQPDLVILGFNPDNDVRNNSRTLEPYKDRPFYSLRDGLLQLDDRFLRETDFEKLPGHNPWGQLKKHYKSPSRRVGWDFVGRSGISYRCVAPAFV